MINTSRLLGTVGVLALAVLGANPALASTQAGSTITNTVSVNFQVGGVAQTATSSSDTFTVDRKINLTVAESGSTTTTVSPGQTSAITTFVVTNLSNATLDFALTTAQLATSGTAAHGGTDSFNTSNVKIYVESDAVAGYSAGDTLVTYLDELAGDGGAKTVYVLSDVPLSLATGSVAGVTLTATAREGAGSGSQGAAITQTTGANTAGMDTVFADTTAGVTDSVRDGAHSAADDYTVLAAALSAAKTSKVISDPVNGTTNPKLIPGATIEYCIAVSNAAGSATATNVALSDTLPTTVTYNSGYGIFINGTVDGTGACNVDGTAGGTFGSGAVSGTLSDIAASVTRTLRFRATIN